jgi:hypothetical protein
MQNDSSSPYLTKSAALFETDMTTTLLFKLSSLMSFLAGPLRYLMVAQMAVSKLLTTLIPTLSSYIPETPAYWLINHVQDVVDLRTKSAPNTKKRVDLVQFMIDASTNDDI